MPLWKRRIHSLLLMSVEKMGIREILDGQMMVGVLHSRYPLVRRGISNSRAPGNPCLAGGSPFQGQQQVMCNLVTYWGWGLHFWQIKNPAVKQGDVTAQHYWT